MKALALVIISLFLAGCVTTQTQQVKVVTTVQNQNLPNVPKLPPAQLKRVKWDFPRDLSRLEVKDTPECLAATDKSSPSFLRDCTFHPIIKNTNIFIGVDKENFENVNENQNTLLAREQQYRTRIDEVNRQRAEARGETKPVSMKATRKKKPRYVIVSKIKD